MCILRFPASESRVYLPEFQDFSLQPTGCLCEVIHIRRVDGGAL
ncbi:hypothetical protein SA43_4456 [Salmonella enterica subsp. enterica serovar Agona str. 43.E.09]|nr:hypothetical protein SA43_4456 [Salmonella enterica subsp. enterica serovar Agona str. 43.E.09]